MRGTASLVVCLLPLLLAACLPRGETGTRQTGHSGIAGAFSSREVISDHPHHVLVGQALILTRGEDTHYVLEVGQVRDAVHHRLRMDEAWWNGQRLPFRGATRRERYCVADWRCDGFRIGVFAFTETGFHRATQTGFQARLIGPDVAIDINVPARLFAEAWVHAAEAQRPP